MHVRNAASPAAAQDASSPEPQAVIAAVFVPDSVLVRASAQVPPFLKVPNDVTTSNYTSGVVVVAPALQK